MPRQVEVLGVRQEFVQTYFQINNHLEKLFKWKLLRYANSLPDQLDIHDSNHKTKKLLSYSLLNHPSARTHPYPASKPGPDTPYYS